MAGEEVFCTVSGFGLFVTTGFAGAGFFTTGFDGVLAWGLGFVAGLLVVVFGGVVFVTELDCGAVLFTVGLSRKKGST
jgi:hypothetical protein